MSEERLPEDIRTALAAYRSEKTAARWTSLAQMSVRDVEVLDALKAMNPDFPDPFSLPVDGLLESSDDFFQWPVLPHPDDVERAIARILKR